MQFFQSNQQHNAVYVSEKAAAIYPGLSYHRCNIDVPLPLRYFIAAVEEVMDFAEHRAALIDRFLHAT